MTDTERLDRLEAEFARLKDENEGLKLRDARRESEHRNILAKWEEITATGDRLRDDTEEHIRLFKKYWDERLSSRLADGGGNGDAATITDLMELFRVVDAQWAAVRANQKLIDDAVTLMGRLVRIVSQLVG